MNSIQHVPYPVSELEKIVVTIVSIGSKGDGIAKVDGFVLVVPLGEKGKSYRVQVTAIRGKVGFAKIISEVDNIPQY